jgi:hypothetical protein
MNLFDRLKQLKLIEPNQAFSERSRREVMSFQPAIFPFKRVTPWQVFVRIIETGVVAGLAALFIFIMTGGVATSPLAPIPFSAVNPEALHAEAQAIDMQIKLANLVYDASKSDGAATQSTVITGLVAKRIALISGTSNATMSTSSTVATTSAGAATSSLTVDDALKALSE